MRWLLLLIPLLFLYYLFKPENIPIPENAWEQAIEVRDYFRTQGQDIPVDEVYQWITTKAK